MRSFFVAAIAFLMCPAPGWASCFTVGLEERPHHGFVAPLVEDAFGRAGLCVEFRRMPPQRLERDLLNGAIDFNAPRERGFVNRSPDLLLVTTPLATAEAVFIQRADNARPVDDFQDIAAMTPGVMLGVRWAEAAITAAGGEYRSFSALNQMLKVLILGRIDGVLTDSESLSIWTYRNLLRLDDFLVSDGLASLSGHIVARAGLEDAVARLDETLGAMRVSGQLDRIIDEWVRDNVRPQMRYTISGSDDWWPFAYRGLDGEAQGVFVRMVPLVLREAGFDAYQIDLDATEEENALLTGVIDVELASPDWFGGAYPEPFLSSMPLFEVRDVIIGRSDARRAHGPNALDGARVGTVAGYAYAGDERWRRVDFDTERNLIAALQDGALDYGVVAETVFSRETERGAAGNVVIHSVHGENAITFRLNERLEPFLANLNAAIQRLRARNAFVTMTAFAR